MIEMIFRLLACLLILLTVSCTKDKTSPNSNIAIQLCDSINIRYSSCILPTLKAHCYACHSDSASQNGSIAFDMENFASLKTYLSYYYRNDSIYGSKFYHIINQTQGVIPMPPAPARKLSDPDIALIGLWIEQGATSN